MRWVLLGNSGSGKTSAAVRLAERWGLPMLELDGVAWEPGQMAVPRDPGEAAAAVRAFCQTHPGWVVEGCYADLAQVAAAEGGTVIHLDPGPAVCTRRAKGRAFEPHKFADLREQEERLPFLLSWILDYPERAGAMGRSAHRDLVAQLGGPTWVTVPPWRSGFATLRLASDEDLPLYHRWLPALEVPDEPPDLDRWRALIRDFTWILEADGEPAGFVWWNRMRDAVLVRQIVVDPAFRGRGLGKVMLLALAEFARAEGFERWELNVKPDNEPALQLYRSLGMVPSGDLTAVRISPERLPVGNEPEPVPPEEEGRWEQALGVEPGLLASRRAGGASILGLTGAGGKPCAVAAFDPGFPGCFPFRAVDVPSGIGLFSGCARQVEAPEVQVVVQDHPELETTFVQLGGRVVLRALHMEGPLPE